MTSRKVIRENLGLSKGQMCFICGMKEGAFSAAERRKAPLVGAADELFLAYFDYVRLYGEPSLESLPNYDSVIFEQKVSSLESQLRKARRRLVGLIKKYDGAVNNYKLSVASLKGINLLKEVVMGNSVDLRDRVEAARLMQIQKLIKSQFDTVVLYKMRLEWTTAEINMLTKMLEDGAIV